MLKARAGKNVSMKRRIVNILSLAGHVVSVPGAHLCHCSREQPDSMSGNGHGCVPIKFYL